jgi:hypothetical protein
MTTYTSPFTGDVVQPTDVSYFALTFGTSQELSWPDYTVSGGTTVAVARIMDCNATAAGLTITLPPGDQQSVGTDILFRNVGSNTFTVQVQSGSPSVSIAAGEARYFYLVNNTTTDGTYRNFTYGTGTSSADAASLVGNGLTNLNGLLQTSTITIETSSSPTLNESVRAYAYVWTGGAGTFTLPTAASVSAGWYVIIRNSGTGSLTVAAQGANTLNGNSSIIFYPGDSAVVVLNKTTGRFFTIGLPSQSVVTYSSAVYDVDNIVGNTLSLITFAPTIQTYVATSGTRTQNLNVTLPAITQLYVVNNATGQGGYAITFQIDGSLSVPVSFANGTTALLLSDGVDLYILTQTTTGIFYADNGSVSAPSFTFNSDTNTGMYLAATNDLRLTTNSADMMRFNNTNPASPQVSTTATFNAGLIPGGTF